MSNVLVDDPSLMLNRSLDDVSDFLQGELDERIKNGEVPITGMVLDGYSNDGVPVQLKITLSLRGEKNDK